MKPPLTLLLLALSLHTFARTWYVNVHGNMADGSSWSSPFTNLRTALALASSGDIIKVAGGTYVASNNTYLDSNFTIPRGIILLGGYPTTGNPTDAQRNWVLYPTLLTKPNYSTALVVANNIDTATVIDGLQLGFAEPSLSIVNCSHLTISNTLVEGGGGATITGGTPVFINCVFDKNENTSGVINQTGGANSAFYNCIISNTVYSPYTIINQNSSMSLINCAIVNNPVTGYFGSGTGTVTIRNTIFWNNKMDYTLEAVDINPGTQTVDIANSLTQTYFQDGVPNLFVNDNPRFYNIANPAGADNTWFTADDGLQLTAPCSPGLNTGDNNSVASVTTDLLNRPRIFNGGVVDLGPYELQSTPAAPSATVYVNSTAAGAGNGSSWANAFTTLQQALLYCADTIKVAAGVYLTSNSWDQDSIFNLENKTVILGGYPAAGNPTDAQRDAINNQTLLKGNYPMTGSGVTHAILQAFHCDNTTMIDGFAFDNEEYSNNSGSVPSFYIGYESKLKVNNCRFLVVNNNNQGGGGMTISGNSTPVITHSIFNTDGSTLSGGAINCQSSSPTIRNCEFSSITNNGPTYRGTGWAILAQQSTGVVDSCTFDKQSSNAVGPEVVLAGTTMQFTNCRFHAFASGGSLLATSQTGSSSFTNCVFRDIAQDAIYNDNSSPVFTHCLFDSNNLAVTNTNYAAPVFNNCVSLNGIFLQNTKSAPTINNSTIVNTSGSAASQELVINNDSSTLRANNTIFWGLKLAQGHKDIGDSAGGRPSTSILNNCITRGYGVDGVGGNRVHTDPRFYRLSDIYGPDHTIFTADDGIRLAACSPAINTGNNSAGVVTTTDILGSPRIYSNTVDMGAYEFQQTPYKANSFYVDASAAGSNNGSSWQNAYTDLQTAVCNVCSDTLRVAAGVYKPALNDPDSSFDFGRDFTLLGGYPAGGSSDAQRDPFAYLTVLSGNIGNLADSTDNTKSIVTIEGVPDSMLIDGVVVRDNYHKVSGIVIGTSSGPALYSYYTNLTIRNCQFINNHGSLNGGAINFSSGPLYLSKSVFLKNSAADYGGAIYCGSILHLDQCIFDQNYAYGQGGAIYAWSTYDIKNCLFFKNYTTAATNAAGTGGAIDATQGGGAITNCTFVGDSAAYPSGGAIQLSAIYGGLGNPIQNCLFYNNSAGGSTTMQGADIGHANYNTVFNSLVQVARSGNNTAGLDPKFIDINNPIGKDGKWFTADDGLQVLYGSPAIDYGADNYITGFSNDLAGDSRIVGAAVDAGAYEFQDRPLALAGNDTLICAGNAIPIGRAGDPAFTYTWTSVPTGYTSSNPTPVVSPNATTRYYLSVTDGTTTSTDSVQISTANSLAPALTIFTDTSGVCQGAPVTFYAYPVYGGDNAAYQWQVNGANSGANSPQFTSSALTDGNTITAILTSSVSCASPKTATSNPIKLKVNSTAAPTVAITGPQTPPCVNGDFTLRVTSTNGGDQPTYTWYTFQGNVKTTADTIITSIPDTLSNIGVMVTSSNGCARPSTAYSSIPVHAVESAPLSVTIAAATTAICSGIPDVFTATTVNAGNAPSYQWMIDGQNVGTNSNILNVSTLNNRDQVSVKVSGSGACISTTPATSNMLTMTVYPNATPAITITRSSAAVGQPVTLSAITVNGGATPIYQWQDSTDASGWTNITGATTATLSYQSPVTGSSVRCQLTSSLTCVTDHMVNSPALVFSSASGTSNPSTTDSGSSVHYYPNPIHSSLTIDSLQSSAAGGAPWDAVEIRSVTGQQPLMVVPLTPQQTQVTVDMGTLPRGIYIVGLIRRSGQSKYFTVLKM